MVNKLGVMQPYVFPYIGYFQLIHSVDKFVFYDDVNFIKHGWINRNNILVNGQKHLFTVPIKSLSSNKKILETEIDNSKKWSDKFLNSLFHSYKKAQNFNESYNLLESVFSIKSESISDFAKDSVLKICQHIDLKTEFVNSSTIYNNEQLTGYNRILDICKQEKIDNYMNPIGGIELYDKKMFAYHNVNLHFIKSKVITYRQFDKPFVQGLSIIDVLMFNSKEQIRAMLNQYELV